MRTFFCIPIIDKHCETLAHTAVRVRSITQTKASWVSQANYHITLRFLGDIDPALIVDLDHLCCTLAETIEPFECTLDRLGAFPSVDKARVLWVGGDIHPSFQRLSMALSKGLADLGFPRAKKESVVHVTLARIKDRPDPPLARVIEALGPLKPMYVTIDRLVLMESMLTAQGAVYTPLFTTKLGAFRT
jgi:RNA 2',3'-cyclic 3'-phosphodiesterase